MKILRAIYTVVVNIIFLPITAIVFMSMFAVVWSTTKSFTEAREWSVDGIIYLLRDAELFIKYGVSREP